MWQFFNEKGKKVVQLAHKEALRLGHDVIGTEHLLLGLLSDMDPICAQMLEAQGVTAMEIKNRIDSLVEKNQPKDKIVDLPLSPHARRNINEFGG